MKRFKKINGEWPCTANKIGTFSGLLVILMMFSCSDSVERETAAPGENQAPVILQYLEENGNVINAEPAPFLVNAKEIYERLVANNILVIDLRPPADFSKGHIPNAVNVVPAQIPEYFEQKIDPAAFDRIYLVCPNAHLSTYVVGMLRFMGYENTFALRFGMSAWNSKIGDHYWMAAISDRMENRLETQAHSKNEAGDLPYVYTDETEPFLMLRSRIKEVLQFGMDDLFISNTEVFRNPESYYIVNYWPENLYNMGHIPGAIQYDPKKSLTSHAELNTLPADKPIVIYCFTGQNAVLVTGFLRILGYEAYGLKYGANSFIHQTMQRLYVDRPGRFFVRERIQEFPLEGGTGQKTNSEEKPQTDIREETLSVEGGC